MPWQETVSDVGECAECGAEVAMDHLSDANDLHCGCTEPQECDKCGRLTDAAELSYVVHEDRQPSGEITTEEGEICPDCYRGGPY